MHYLIYETTNVVNGKKYRGYHATQDLEDGYIGSGSALSKAVEKHGKEKFVREILEFCSSPEEMVEREKFYVDEEWVKRRDTYNLQVGGRFEPLSEESKQQISDTLKKKYASGELVSPHRGKVPWNKGKKMSVEYCDAVKRGITLSDREPWNKGMTGTTPWNKGKETGPLSDSHRANIAASRKGILPWNTGKDCTGVWKGKTSSNKGKSKKTYICPHCKSEIAGILNFHKWHNDNCKLKGVSFPSSIS
jgi:hypothetical protein